MRWDTCLGIPVTYSKTPGELKDRGKRENEMIEDDILSDGWSLHIEIHYLETK